MSSKFITSAVLLCCSFVWCTAQFNSSSYSSLYDSERAASLREHVKYIASSGMEGRKAGSQGEKMTAEYVYDCLKSYGVDMLTPRDGDKFGISPRGTDTTVSRNVYGFIQGYDAALKDRYIVVGARMDNLGSGTMTVDGRKVETIYYGANGNASGVALMLELAKMVSVNSLLFRRSVIFVGFGASSQTFAGAWYFLNRSFAADVSRIDAMINLDMLGSQTNSALYAYTSSNQDLNSLLGTLSEELQPIKPEITANQPYPSDHIAFYDKEIPSVMFTSGRYAEHNTTKDTESIISYEFMDRELEFIYNATLSLANTSGKISFTSTPPGTPGKHPDDVVSYYDCDVKPSFLGNTDPRFFLTNWVYQYLKYPQKAVEKGIQGVVQVSFIIDKDGNLTDATVTRSVDPLLDAEALRVINGSPKWRSGRVRGQKVRSSMTLSIEFRLESSSQRRKIGISNSKK